MTTPSSSDVGPPLPPGGDDHRYSFSGSSIPPPPPPRPGESPELHSDRDSDESPPPPPPFSQTILRPSSHSRTRSRLSSSRSPSPPPAPSRPIDNDDNDSQEDPFSYQDHLGSEDDEDDSDLDPSMHQDGFGSMSPDDGTALGGRRSGSKSANKIPAEGKSKLSFTAPTQTSPLAASGSTSGGASSALFAPVPSPSSTQQSKEGVSLSSLSNQLALHMELQSFAAQRKRSIIMTGAAANSLIPQTSPAQQNDSVAPAPIAAAPPTRRTQNIRSMSMSLAQGASLFSRPSGTAGVGSGTGAGPIVSPAFAALTKARKRQKRAGRRGDEGVLDLFGDGAAGTPASASHSSKRRSLLFLSPPGGLPGINESDGLPQRDRAFAAGGSPLLNLLEEQEDPLSHLPYAPGTTATPSAASSVGASKRGSMLLGEERSDSRSQSMSSSIPPPPPMSPSVSRAGAAGGGIGAGGGSSVNSSTSETSSSQPGVGGDGPFINDDLTACFHSSPAHISHSFPSRKILRAPLRSLDLLQDIPSSSTPAMLQRKQDSLEFLLDALKSHRAEFREQHLHGLKEENHLLQVLVDALKKKEEDGGGASHHGRSADTHWRAVLTKHLASLRAFAVSNMALHTASTHEALVLEDLRRRMQLQGRPDGMVGSAGGGEEAGGGGGEKSLNHMISSLHPPSTTTPAAHPPSSRPLLSLAEISAKARSLAPSSLNSFQHGPAAGLSSPPPTTAHLPSMGAMDLHGAGTGHTPQTQLQRFAITKINKIRKNTPRILEIDLTTKTMTICKKVSGSSKHDKEDAGDEFANRDIVIAPGALQAAELHAKNELQLELRFFVYNTQAGNVMMGNNQPWNNALSPTSLPAGSKSPPPSSNGKQLKNWKILFSSKVERERFYRLLQVTLLTPDSGTGSTTANGSGSRRPSHSMQGGAASQRGELTSSDSHLHSHSHAASMNPSSSGPLQTLYPHPYPGGVTQPQAYIPRIPVLTSAILSSVRLLPLLPLASSLHTIWCLQKKEQGWKYGLKLAAGAGAGENQKKTHPFLVPFHSLPLSRRDYNLKVVTATLATVLALGFQIRKTFTGEDTLLDARAKEKQAAQGGGLGSGNIPSAPGSSSSSTHPPQPLGSISSDLLSLIDFFAESSHDLWAEDKLAQGWRYGANKNMESKTHPGLVPYAVLPPVWQEKERNQAYKILGTLVDWGYELVKADAPSGTGGANSSSSSAQPIAGSLKRPPVSVIGGGLSTTSHRVLSSQTFAPPTQHR